MPAGDPLGDESILAARAPVEAKIVGVPSHRAIDEKKRLSIVAGDGQTAKEGAPDDSDIKPSNIPPPYDEDLDKEKDIDEEVIIITGADASRYLLPLRDDFEPALTFRSLFLATGFSAFQAVMHQIYDVTHRAQLSLVTG